MTLPWWVYVAMGVVDVVWLLLAWRRVDAWGRGACAVVVAVQLAWLLSLAEVLGSGWRTAGIDLANVVWHVAIAPASIVWLGLSAVLRCFGRRFC